MAETAATFPLEQFVQPVLGLDDMWLAVGTGIDGYVPLTEATSQNAQAWMDAVGSCSTDTLDAKARAAYLVGYVAWAFAHCIGGMRLNGLGVPSLNVSAFAVLHERYGWEEDGLTGFSTRFRTCLMASPNSHQTVLDTDGVRALIIAAHTPLIEHLVALTKLGRSAMWRLVADSVAAAWLTIGKEIGRAADAMDDADAILRFAGSPLSNKQTGFIEITLKDDADPDRVLNSAWFRARGGCCRYYTSPESEGNYCTTCVLRTPESRDRRLVDYLRRIATEAA